MPSKARVPGDAACTFDHFLGIDYSGADTPGKRLNGLRVYKASAAGNIAVVPPEGARHWSRVSLHEWLTGFLIKNPRTLAGIDLGLGFPLAYHEKYGTGEDYSAFLDDFRKHWPADEPGVRVESLRAGNARQGDASWLRLTDRWTSSATSVFRLQGQGCVGKSTHAGLPWLAKMRRATGSRLHFWPFDGWNPQPGIPVIAEVYPSLWSRRFPREDRDSHGQDAFATAAWLQRSADNGMLTRYFSPPLTPEERAIVQKEGWILGVL